MKNDAMPTQEEMKSMFVPLLQADGKKYKKNKNVLAKKAKVGEQVQTITDDGLETINEAEQGDFIIKNMTQAEEQYLVPEEKFRQKYHYIRRAKAGFSLYESSGEICALYLDEKLLAELKLPTCFHFEAPWGEKMVAKASDFLACPLDYSEIYRIAKKEFYETYELME